MKKVILFVSMIVLASCKQDAAPSEDKHMHNETTMSTETAASSEKKPLSPHISAMAMIGDAHIHFDYSSPGVRNRLVFGGLLPYDLVWQAGAHQATWMETNKDLSIAGKELKAGKYGFFVIPNEKEWTVIFNSNWDQHGKDEYDEKDDVLRFKVIPSISEDVQEHLEYKVKKNSDSSGNISMSWEKVTISFPFDVK